MAQLELGRLKISDNPPPPPRPKNPYRVFQQTYTIIDKKEIKVHVILHQLHSRLSPANTAYTYSSIAQDDPLSQTLLWKPVDTI